MQFTMARDNLGNTYHDLGKFPRKKLMERLGYKFAKRMYCDDPLTKKPVHVGWVIGPHWCSVYYVTPMRNPVD